MLYIVNLKTYPDILFTVDEVTEGAVLPYLQHNEMVYAAFRERYRAKEYAAYMNFKFVYAPSGGAVNEALKNDR